jgi:hypothetical protein
MGRPAFVGHHATSADRVESDFANRKEVAEIEEYCIDRRFKVERMVGDG